MEAGRKYKMKRIIGIMVICMAIVMFTACGGGSDSDSSNSSAYRVITCDESGAPVEGVSVQFCSDEFCQTGETDKDGIAVFESEEGAYTVHVTDVPEGFAEDDTEYPAPETYGDVNITLKSAK